MESIYDISVQDGRGQMVHLSDYKGKVLLIVNIASGCGQTPQLAGLQKLYEQYRDQGLEVLAFPSNDFNQESKGNSEIEEFCSIRYSTDFKVFNKAKVRGSHAQPLYKFLAKKAALGPFKNYPIWNFHKYLVDRNGRVATWFNPWAKPESDKITAAIVRLLGKKAVNKVSKVTA